MQMRCHLAQVNIARARASIDDPVMAGFVARLDEINALAEASPGFLWRLKGDAETVVQAWPEETVLTNMSVWETPQHLHQFVYRSMHAEVLRQKKSWFERMPQMHMAMWWIAPGHLPTVDEAKERLAYLQQNGESEFAFTFASLLSGRGEDGRPAFVAPPLLQPCAS